jgi:hypothetical protein
MKKIKKQVKIKSIMKKITKKVVKVAVKSVVKKVKKLVPPQVVNNVCPECRGSGLWRPDFVNSPQCSKCLGHGVI